MLTSAVSRLMYHPLKKFYKFVLKRMIGNFLKNELDLEQLDVELTKGVVELRNLDLNIDLLNDMLEGLPLTILSGSIRYVRATIPWRNIMSGGTQHCQLHVEGLHIVVVPSEQVERKVSSGSSLLSMSLATDPSELHRKLQFTLEEDVDDDDMDDMEQQQARTAAMNMKPTEDDGLKVVASFLEQVVSQTELQVNDVTVQIQHQQKNGEKNTVVLVHLPWVELTDEYANKQKTTSNTSTSSSTSTSTDQPSQEDTPSSNLVLGPKYEYHKSIRFHGFRVELYEELSQMALDSSFPVFDHPHTSISSTSSSSSQRPTPITIIHGDTDQDCVINLRVRIKEYGAHVDSTCFIRSMRCAMTPHQAALIVDLLGAMGTSSRQLATEAARAMEKAQRNGNIDTTTQQQVEITSRPLTHHDFNVIDDLLHDYQTKTTTSTSSHHHTTSQEQFYEMNDTMHDVDTSIPTTSTTSHPTSTSPSTSTSSALELWSLQLQLLHASITLVHSDTTPLPHEWWLSPVTELSPFLPTSSSSPPTSTSPSSDTDVPPALANLTGDHLSLWLKHTHLTIHQRSNETSLCVNLGSVQLMEYLKQTDTSTSSSTSTSTSTSTPSFKRRPLVTFDVAALEPITPDSHHYHAQHISPSHTSTSDPSSADEMAAFLASTAHLLHPHLSIETVSSISPSALAPLPSTSDIPSATNVTHRMTVTVRPICIDWDLGLADRLNDITRAFTDTTAYLSLFLSDSQSDVTSPHPTWDIMHDIANTQAHRYESDRDIQPPITTTRIVASRVQLKVSFPDSPSAPRPTVATIPSHDARGSLRPEQLLLELSDVDASTEMLADAQAAAMRDTEWLIRFGWGAAYLIMPVDATSQPLIKRVLTTTSNTSTATPFVKILSRSLLVTPFHPLQDPSLPPPSSHTQFSSRTQTLEDLFFQALPTFRWWEPGKSSNNNNNNNNHTEPTTRLFTGGNDGHATHTAADKTLPNSAQFESTAVVQSSIVVTLGLPACSVDLTKTEYDLIMILYNIYSEMMDGVPTSTSAPSHSRRTSHTFSTQPQEMVEDGLTGPSRRTGIERAHGIDGDDEQHMGMSRSDSFSGSDSDSSSDMFESVVGADSVILRAPQDDDSDDDARTHHRHQQRRWKKQQQQQQQQQHKQKQQQPVHEEEEDDDSSSGGEEVDGPLTMDSADAKHDEDDEIHSRHMHVTHASSPPPYISPQHHTLASSETETISHRASDVDLANMDVHDVDLLQSNLFHPSLETSQQLSLSTSQLFTSHPNMTTSQLFTSHANTIGTADVPSTFFTQGSGSPSDAASGSLSGSNLSGVGSGMGSGTFDHEHDLLSTSIAQLPLPPQQHDISDSGFFTQHHDNDHENDDINRLPDAFHTFSLRTGAMSPHETPLSDTDSNADVDVDVDVTSDHEPAFATSSHQHDATAVEEQPQEHDEAAHINTDDVFAHASYTSMVSQFLPPQQTQQQQPSSMTASSDGDDNATGMGVSQYQSFVAPRPDASVMTTQVPDDDASDTTASPTHATSQHTGSASAVYAQMASQPSHHRDVRSPRKSLPSPHKHFLALQLTIQQGSFCLHEDDVSVRAAQATADALAAASGMAARTPSPPQTYHCDVGEVYVFQVVQFEGKPVTYVSARAGDVTMREYTQVIPTTSQLMTQPSIPVLFKTMGEGDDTKPSELSRATSHLSTTPTDWFDSSAWRNPVLICNFVMKLNTSLNVRDTVAVINLRALTWQYRVESEWMIKLMNWFTPTPTVATTTTSTSTTSSAFPAIPVPTSPVINDVVKLYLHAYDCAVDYNPLTISPRAILSFDHIQLSTIIYPASPSSSFKLEFRDGSMFVLHRTDKIDFAPCHNRYQLDPPYLHRLSHDSLFAHLESHAFARVATLDFLEVDIHQHTPPTLPPGAVYEPTVPELAIEIRNGLLTVFTCWDSFQTVVELLTHVVDSVSEQLKMPEIDIVFPSQESQQHDDDEDDHNDMEAGLGKVPSVRFADDPSTSSPPSRDLLADLDPDMFGADLGSANQYGASSMSHHLIDNYHDEKSRQTSISLALQAAAEREIARALREREMATFNANYGEDYGGPHVPFSYHQQHQPQHRIRDDSNVDYMARWFSQRERDALNDDHKITTSEDAPHDYRAHFIRELREFERRAARGGRSNRPVPPQVIDNHVSMPDKDDYQSDETAYLHPPKHFPKPITQVVFLDWNVVWRLFGGSDWVEEDVDVKQDENGDEKHHEETKQNTPTHVPRQPSRDEHIQQHTWYDGVDPMVLHQHSSFTNMDGQMGGVGIDLDEKYVHVTSTPTSTSIPPRKESDAAMQTVHIPPTSHPVRDLNTYMDTAGQHDPFLPSYATPPSQPPTFSSPTSSPSTPVCKGTRLTDSVIEFHFDGATIRLDTYARAEQIASRTAIAINQFEIHDCLATSSFKKMLCYYRTQPHGRALHSSMFRLDLVSVRPDVKRHTEEYRVECTILPLRLNIDQDALEFLISFFTHDPLTTSAKRDAELAKKQQQQQQVDRAFASTDKATSFPSHPAYLDQGDHKHMESNNTTTSTSTVPTPSYIQHFVVRALRICVDYRPKRVNYRGLQDGDYAQLVHLFPLEQVEIDLKRVTLTGIQGWDRVFLQLVTVWGQDVARTQAHRYLAGVQPIRSVVNVGAGVADLLLMPIQQYQKNGRLARGVQQGTMSFAKSVAMEGMNVATRIAQGAQTLLETMDEVVSSRPIDRPTAPTRSRRKRVIQSQPRSRDPAATHHTRYDKMADQPSGYREGFRQAYESLARALQTAAHGIVVVPQEDYVRYGTREAVKSAIRAVPSAILRPMIGASEALSKALLGAQNTLDPDRAKESQDKYKTSRNTTTS